MRLGRIASPDGVAFVVIEGDSNSDAVCREIAEQYLSRNPTFTGRSWPLADVRLLAPILAATLIFGPVGFLAFVVVRLVRGRRAATVAS